jgi:hypothetical protein
MDKVNEKIESLKALGFDQAKIDATMNLLYEDIQLDMLEELAGKASEEEITEYENRIKDAKSADHLLTIIKEIAAKLYNETAEATLQEKLVAKLTQVEDLAKNTKATLEKYQAGDPETVKAVDEAAKTQDAQDIADGILKGE